MVDFLKYIINYVKFFILLRQFDDLRVTISCRCRDNQAHGHNIFIDGITLTYKAASMGIGAHRPDY
jgi:hypothetical protein